MYRLENSSGPLNSNWIIFKKGHEIGHITIELAKRHKITIEDKEWLVYLGAGKNLLSTQLCIKGEDQYLAWSPTKKSIKDYILFKDLGCFETNCNGSFYSIVYQRSKKPKRLNLLKDGTQVASSTYHRGFKPRDIQVKQEIPPLIINSFIYATVLNYA